MEDLPSRSRKGDHRSAGRWFLEQRKDPGRDACREDKCNEAPEGSERGQKDSGRHREAIRKTSKGPGTRLPPSYAVVFSRRASRVGNLPSEEKKVVYPAVVLRFFRQKSNLGLDARPEKRGKGHVTN